MSEREFLPYPPYNPAAEQQLAAKRERKEIRALGLLAGGAILLYILLQNLAVLALQLIGWYDRYTSDPLLQAGVDILIVLFSLLLPFVLVAAPMKRISGVRQALPLEKPEQIGSFLLAVPAGLGFCMFANEVSGYLVTLLSALGLELSSPSLPMAGGVLGVTVSFFRVVVVAALVEEICFRGYVMGTLRKFGDGFAVAMAALVFAVMHCNLIQTPFALIVGFALGYLSIRTGTLWTGILIHAFNNALSFCFSYLLERGDQQAVSLLYAAVTMAITVVGIVCMVVFFLQQRRRAPQTAVRTVSTGWQKTGAFLLNPTMLVALALMVYFTSQFVAKAGTVS